jgi:hypothetical protein
LVADDAVAVEIYLFYCPSSTSCSQYAILPSSGNGLPGLTSTGGMLGSIRRRELTMRNGAGLGLGLAINDGLTMVVAGAPYATVGSNQFEGEMFYFQCSIGGENIYCGTPTPTASRLSSLVTVTLN